MSEFNCPHCNQGGEPDYDDSDFYEDGAEIKYECGSCEKEFLVTVSISINYSAECINHEWGIYQRYLSNPTPEQLDHFERMEKHAWCKDCGACGDLEDIKS